MQYEIKPYDPQAVEPPRHPLNEKLNEKSYECYREFNRARVAYTITALCFVTHRIEGKNRKQCLEIAIGAGRQGNDILNDILEFVFNIKKAILNDPAQSEKVHESVKEYTNERVYKGFVDAMIESARKAGIIQ